jgi:hypothetical protein
MMVELGLDVIAVTDHRCKGPARYLHPTHQHDYDSSVKKRSCTIRLHQYYWWHWLVDQVEPDSDKCGIEEALVFLHCRLHHNDGFEP